MATQSYSTTAAPFIEAAGKNYLDDHWYEYNDSQVSRVQSDKLIKYSPYLLVYRRL